MLFCACTRSAAHAHNPFCYRLPQFFRKSSTSFLCFLTADSSSTVVDSKFFGMPMKSSSSVQEGHS